MGLQVNGYDISNIFFENAWAKFYQGVRLCDQKPVLLKVYKSQTDPECKVLQETLHLYTIMPYKAISSENTTILVMEDIKSIPLSAYLKNHQHALETLLLIAIQLAEILEKIAQIHDIPGAIDLDIFFINKNNHLKIIDLHQFISVNEPLSKKVEQKMHIPLSEESEWQQKGKQSDLHALGAIYYQLFVGSSLPNERSTKEFMNMQTPHEPISAPLVAPDIPKGLYAVIMGCLNKSYACASFVKADLQKCLQFLKETEEIPDFPLQEALPATDAGAAEEIQKLRQSLIEQDRLASLGKLTAGIAHEIKNPLNFVINYAQVASGTMEDLKTAILALKPANEEEIIAIWKDIHESLEAIDKHGNRANNIIKAMLAHSHKEGRDREIINLNQLVDCSISLAYYAFLKNEPLFNAQFIKAYDPNLPMIEGLSGELTRVFINIIDNACYSLLQKTRIESFQPVIEIKTYTEGDYAVIIFKDNGLGISENLLKKIFTPFFTTKPTGSGTGLGLMISHDIIINLHHGKIHFESKEKEMAQITIQLPLKILQA